MIASLSPETLEKLGIAPFQGLLVLAILALAGYLKLQLSSQNRLREEWHSETRNRVDKISEEYDQAIADLYSCEATKNELLYKLRGCEDELNQFRNCRLERCPFRRKTS